MLDGPEQHRLPRSIVSGEPSRRIPSGCHSPPAMQGGGKSTCSRSDRRGSLSLPVFRHFAGQVGRFGQGIERTNPGRIGGRG